MKSEYQIEIIDRIRKLREEKKYTQEKLAYAIGLSPGQIGNIESPKFVLKYTLEHIYKICNEFHIPIEHIFLEDSDFENKVNIDIINLLISKIVQYEK